MWLFKKKGFRIQRVPGNAIWGCLVGVHKVDVDTLSNWMRSVSIEDTINGRKVTRVRIFDMRIVEKEGVTVTGWETFDQYPEILAFEGYLTEMGEASVERKNL